MATALYRLGRYAYRRAWLVITAWLLLLGAALGAGFGFGGTLQESFTIPGTESQQAMDRLGAVFPQAAGASAEVVYASDGDIAEHRELIEHLGETIAAIDGIEAVVTPFDEYAGKQLSDTGHLAITRVQFSDEVSEVAPKTLDALVATRAAAEDAGLTVEFGGMVFQQMVFGVTVVELIGVGFAALVLVIAFGSLVVAGLPLLTAVFGVGITTGGILLVAAFTTVSNSAPLLALMIGLAVGIDYALFIVSRHRQQLAGGEDPEESAGVAVGTAGSAVVFAGVTVIIALLGLLVVGIPFLSVMGVGAAVAVLLAIAASVTLLPALLGLFGARLAPKAGSRAARRASGETRTFGSRWVSWLTRRPVLWSLGVVAVLGVLAVPSLSLQLALPDGGAEPADSTQRRAYDLISEEFGPGYNGPLILTVDITQTVDILEDLDAIAGELRTLDGVDWVSGGLPNPTLDTAIIQVIPETGPDAAATTELVHEIRALAPDIADRYGTPIAVTGVTAVAIDISERLQGALLPFGVIVVGLSIVLLAMVFRSVWVPVTAAAGFLLSVLAAFGVTVAVFQWGWFGELLHLAHAGPILSFMPIILMAVLFGLAMDYQVFLVSGMREEWVHGRSAREAVRGGFAGAARVVTAAALIMFFVFFAFVPEGAGTIKPIALGLAVGIAFDAFLVRMTLIPALLALLGKHAWWLPRWLDRLLPELDVEGVRLSEHREAFAWAQGQDSLVTAEGLVVGPAHDLAGPVTLRLERGGMLLITGDPAHRRMLGATLAGRLEPAGGLAQVDGFPLPSASRPVTRRVALAELSRAEGLEASFRELHAERLRAVSPARRLWRSPRLGFQAIQRLTRAVPGFDADAPLHALAPLPRAVALASLAFAERPLVAVVDLPEWLESTHWAEAIRAFEALSAGAAVLITAPSTIETLPLASLAVEPFHGAADPAPALEEVTS